MIPLTLPPPPHPDMMDVDRPRLGNSPYSQHRHPHLHPASLAALRPGDRAVHDAHAHPRRPRPSSPTTDLELARERKRARLASGAATSTPDELAERDRDRERRERAERARFSETVSITPFPV